ncbi:hypothetical protein B0H19DRAFT_1255490 [Mycena capillaripes]|nr:hypothetical protein B0H19DRAFT_1255490 [Mycena capillaripes]
MSAENNGNGGHIDKPEPANAPPLEWDWDIEHADRKREAQADAALHGATPFEVNRRVLKDVVLEHMKTPVARIVFLSAGTFHKAYLITLTSGHQLIARVARRFMPRLKTESEIATLRYLSEKTQVPVPEVHCYDSNPYNRLGGEYILMSKARLRMDTGIPAGARHPTLAGVPLPQLRAARVPAGEPRGADDPSLWAPLLPDRLALQRARPRRVHARPAPAPISTPTPAPLSSHSNAPTPTLTRMQTLISAFASAPSLDTPRASHQEAYVAFPFSPTLTPRVPPPSTSSASSTPHPPQPPPFHVGPIISWPFFGTHRGDLPSSAVPRGPFPSTLHYFTACVTREVLAVQRENAGSAAGHKLHLDPAGIRSSRHHHVAGVPGDESDESDEWGLEESEDNLNGGSGPPGEEEEEFALDAHDLSLENVFVDPDDPAVIVRFLPQWQMPDKSESASASAAVGLPRSMFISAIVLAVESKTV